MFSQPSLASRENIAPPRYLAKQYLVIFGNILIWIFGLSNIAPPRLDELLQVLKKKQLKRYEKQLMKIKVYMV